MEDFGDFKQETENAEDPQQISSRVRLPRNKELIGTILQRFGGNRMEVKTTDGKIRNCRVPGKYKRALWLRPRDIVLITPWEDNNEKGDIIYKYDSSSINNLKKKGFLKDLTNEF